MSVLNRSLPKVRNKVVLHSTVRPDDGILAVAAALIGRNRPPIVLLDDPATAKLFDRFLATGTRTVRKRSLRGLFHYLTAQHVLMTHGLYGDMKPPKHQVVVNLWHGEPPTKPVQQFEGAGPLLSTIAPVCSTLGRAYRCAEFGLRPAQVPIIGAPRNDRLIAADPDELRLRLLGDPPGRKLFVWLPTYRAAAYGRGRRVDIADSPPGIPFEPEAASVLDRWLEERGAVALVKPHPLAPRSGNVGGKGIRVINDSDLDEAGVTLYQLLAASDCLITDLSSVWVDYLLVGKPIVFAFPDIDEYRRSRGINLEPYEHWVPGPLTRTVDELISEIDRLITGDDPMARERERARLRFHRFADRASTARLLDAIGISASGERPG